MVKRDSYHVSLCCHEVEDYHRRRNKSCKNVRSRCCSKLSVIATILERPETPKQSYWNSRDVCREFSSEYMPFSRRFQREIVEYFYYFHNFPRPPFQLTRSAETTSLQIWQNHVTKVIYKSPKLWCSPWWSLKRFLSWFPVKPTVIHRKHCINAWWLDSMPFGFNLALKLCAMLWFFNFYFLTKNGERFFPETLNPAMR